MHECSGHEIRTARMMLAMTDGNRGALQDVFDEVGPCDRCWRQIAVWAVHMVAANRITQSESIEAAAHYAITEIERLIAQ